MVLRRSCHPLHHQVRCLHPCLQPIHPLHFLWSRVIRPSDQPDRTDTFAIKEEPAPPGRGDETAPFQLGPHRMGAGGSVQIPLVSPDTLRADNILDNDLVLQDRNAPLRYLPNDFTYGSCCWSLHILPAFNAASPPTWSCNCCDCHDACYCCNLPKLDSCFAQHETLTAPVDKHSNTGEVHSCKSSV